MGRATYLEHGGTPHVIDLDDGVSLMEGAVRNDIPGIDGDCGGMRACATCHVHVLPAWLAVVGGAGEQEDELLDLVPDRDAASRLSCQIVMSSNTDGITVQLPESQH